MAASYLGIWSFHMDFQILVWHIEGIAANCLSLLCDTLSMNSANVYLSEDTVGNPKIEKDFRAFLFFKGLFGM